MLRIFVFVSFALLLIAALLKPIHAQEQVSNEAVSESLNDVSSAGSPPDLDALWSTRNIQPLRDWVSSLNEVRANRPDALRIRARLAQFDGDLDQAQEWVEQALEAVSDSPDLKSRLLFERANLKLNELDDSGMFRSLRIARSVREDFEQAVELDPDYIPAWFGLLQYHSNAPAIAGGREARAEQAREQLTTLAPARLAGLDALQLLGQDKPEAALERFDFALATGSNPGRPQWLLYKSLALQGLERFDEAAELLEQAIAEYPQHAGLWYQRARVSAESGLNLSRGLEAMLEYNALPHWPDDPEPAAAWWRIGQIQKLMDRTEGAREAFEYSLSLDPEFEESRQALAELE